MSNKAKKTFEESSVGIPLEISTNEIHTHGHTFHPLSPCTTPFINIHFFITILHTHALAKSFITSDPPCTFLDRGTIVDESLAHNTTHHVEHLQVYRIPCSLIIDNLLVTFLDGGPW